MDTPDQEVHPFMITAHLAAERKRREIPEDPNDRVSPLSIPSTGRGNSDDGQSWMNPTANQLYNALKRKDKPIDPSATASVANAHNMVTSQTWDNVMEYEKEFFDTCPNPKLARFVGEYGNDSIKAKIMSAVYDIKPFDRHDWTVDRCGKEVRYIIDYYCVVEQRQVQEDEDQDDLDEGTTLENGIVTDTVYYIDARPAPTLQGLYERSRLAVKRWWKGENFW